MAGSGDIILGNGYPVFRIVNKTKNISTIVELPECNAEGEPQNHKVVGMIRRRRLNGKMTIKRKFTGGILILKWTLKYNNNISGTDSKKVETILNACFNPQTYDVFLTPYNEVPLEYQVYIANDEFDIDVQKGGQYAQGMKLSDLEFETTELQNLNWPQVLTETVTYVSFDDFV